MKNSILISFTAFLVSYSAFTQTRLDIIKIGHPTLRAQAEEINHTVIQTVEFQKLIDDMIFTMDKAGGVGLAAPQVNKSIRIFVMKSWPNVPLTVVINPKIEYLEAYGKKDSTEGCLSIPGQNIRLKRFKKIHISYFNRTGEYVSTELAGFGAIIAQHEYDHLNGILIVDLVDQILSKMNYSGFANAPLM